MPCSRVITEYSIHRVLHYPMIDCLPLPARLSSLGRPSCTKFSTFPQLQVNQWMECQLPSCLPLELPPPSTYPILLSHGLQVQFQTCSITPSKCISSKLAWSRPPSSHDQGLQVHLESHTIMASKPVRLWPPSVSPNSVDHSLQVHIENSLGCNLQVYL
jgi:hypothetical protein